MSSVGTISLRSISRNLTRKFRELPIRAFSTNNLSDDSVDDAEWNVLGGLGNSPSKNSFFRRLDKLEKGQNELPSYVNRRMDIFDERFDSSNDEMDWKLKKAGTYFEFDPRELEKDDYSFRPDMRFNHGGTYTTKDLDLRKPGITKFSKPQQFDVTTEEALKKADFRNVRFLANFITEAGIIHKRSKMGIRAKAQRKVAREIKTARAFGLMPFTTMGTKSFAFGRSMENNENDFTYQSFGDEYVDGDQTFDDLAAKDEDNSRK